MCDFVLAESVGLTSAPVPMLTGLVKALDRLQRDTKKQLNLPTREQLNAAYDTDTEQDEVMDSEQSELEEQIPSARPVHAPDEEPAETELRPSVRESLAACQRFDSELGKLVRMRLQSAEQLALALLSARSESAQKLNITKESSDAQDRYSPLKLAFLTSSGMMTTGPHQRSERKC